MPGYPDTSKFLKSRIVVFARIPGYTFPDRCPDTIHQPVQCAMVRHVVKIDRREGESIDHYDRRRKTQCRNMVHEHGSWALKWAKRSVDWEEHVLRAAHRCLILGELWAWHDVKWLQQQRGMYVPSSTNSWSTSALSLTAGRTGTRVVQNRPEPRLGESVMLAKHALRQSRTMLRSPHVLSLHTMLQRAAAAVRDFVQSENR